MIHYINADLLDSDCNFICHQVNCMGKMGSGIAKQIRARWPEVYENYSRVVDFDMFGKAQILYIEDANIPRQCVVNLFAQQTYGYDDNRYTSYDAFWMCLNDLRLQIPEGSTIAFPYKIGCGLGGANWEVIEKMIDVVFKDYGVFIYKLED